MAPRLTINRLVGSDSFSIISEGEYLGVSVMVKKIISGCDNQLPAIRKLEDQNVQKLLLIHDTDEKPLIRWVVFRPTKGSLDDYFHSRLDKLSHPMPHHLDALIQMSKGLQFIDSKKLVHGALRPSSILINDSDGRVILKIAVDGLLILPRAAMSVKNAFGLDYLTHWSPELLRAMEQDVDRLPFDMAGDVFSLGCIFYGYVTVGKHPFGRGVAILSNIIGGKNQLADLTDHPAVEVIRQMIENDPKSRPSTGEVLIKLTALQNKANAARTVKTPRVASPSSGGIQADHQRYMNEFRVSRCTDVKCKEKVCFNFHQPNQRRRRSFLKKDGNFNYSAFDVCSKYNKETGKCPNGDQCPLLHENIGNTERGFHLSNYKVELCENFAKKNCNFPNCSFAHGEADRRQPIYGHKGKAKMDADLKNTEAKHKEILMSYKTQQCQFAYDQCPEKGACFKYHIFKKRTETNSVITTSLDKRRCLKKYSYWSRRCPSVYDPKRDEWEDPSNCPEGDSCRYCNTNSEHLYHALIYKTEDCNFWKTADCKRGLLCAFAHGDKRKPNQFQEDDSQLENLKRYLHLL